MGLVVMTLHAYPGGDYRYVDLSWMYDYGTDPQ
jgi:hypothetical protein